MRFETSKPGGRLLFVGKSLFWFIKVATIGVWIKRWYHVIWLVWWSRVLAHALKIDIVNYLHLQIWSYCTRPVFRISNGLLMPLYWAIQVDSLLQNRVRLWGSLMFKFLHLRKAWLKYGNWFCTLLIYRSPNKLHPCSWQKADEIKEVGDLGGCVQLPALEHARFF